MKRSIGYFSFIMLVGLMSFAGFGQTIESYSGTIITYGSGRSTRTTTRSFTLDINQFTSDDQASRSLGILIEGGQDVLLKELKEQNVGRFNLTGRLGRDVNFVRAFDEDGKRKIIAVFERWIEFAEVRGGYRSLDYPFSYLEIVIDPATGKGDGTFFAAARVKWVRDKKTDDYHVEVENFATFPSKLMGVQKRNPK